MNAKEFLKSKYIEDRVLNREDLQEFLVTISQLLSEFNQFYPMFKKPKQVKNEHFSETVIVYELDLGTKEIICFDFGFYNFDTGNWNVLGKDSLILYCWSEIPNPTNFMQNKNWAVDYHEGVSN